MLLSGVFQGANRGCSYGNYPSRLRAGPFDLSGGLGRDRILLRVQMMFFDLFGADGLERAESDMESDFGGLNASLGKLGESFGGEVESSGGSGDRTGFAGVHGLVAVVILGRVRPCDVGRQRNVSNGIDASEKVLDGGETDVALAEFSTGDDFGLKFVMLTEEEMLAHSDLAARTHETLPLVRIVPQLTSEKNSHASAEELAGGGIMGTQNLGFKTFASGIQTCGKYFCVVKGYEVAGI